MEAFFGALHIDLFPVYFIPATLILFIAIIVRRKKPITPHSVVVLMLKTQALTALLIFVLSVAFGGLSEIESEITSGLAKYQQRHYLKACVEDEIQCYINPVKFGR